MHCRGLVSSVDHGGGLTSRGALALLDRDAVHADATQGTSTSSGKVYDYAEPRLGLHLSDVHTSAVICLG